MRFGGIVSRRSEDEAGGVEVGLRRVRVGFGWGRGCGEEVDGVDAAVEVDLERVMRGERRVLFFLRFDSGREVESEVDAVLS